MGQDAPIADLALPDDVALCHQMIRELLEQLRKKTVTLESVQGRLDQLLRRLYGPKGEAFRPDQPGLFDHLLDPEPAASAEASAPTDDAASPPRKRNGHGRRRLPADLPREQVVHDLPDAEKRCPCCHAERIRIGEDTSEQLDYRPAKLLVLQHVRLKYACPRCLAQAVNADPADDAARDSAPRIVTAPKPAQPIDKGLPGPGLLAHVITSKYVDHLPLHRQESILARLGLELPRSTLCDWMAACADLLTPLYAWMLREALGSRVIQTDETRVPVQDQADKTKSGRLWVYVGDRDHPHTIYDYRPDKSRDGPDAILRNYTGFLQADAANVFDGLYLPGAITEVGCWAHARRHFHDANASDVARSAEALARIAGFYAVEDEAKMAIARGKLEGDAADAARLRLRQEKTLPKLAAFAEWIEAQKARVLPKSPMGQAIAYAQRHWRASMRFTEAGCLNIDNNAAERALRAVALGRKNWLFAGSDAGGRTAAIQYTITQTAIRHGLDPFEYLRDVLARLPDHPADRLAELAPHRWAEQRGH